ncbi:MAG: hypothetical protein QOE79_1091 [Sphingomonadales bacterium]|jgi:hypothetical protein|nr:hypothetical protein [Sphingomonadales bacterium]
MMLVGLDRHGDLYWNGERLEQRRFAANLTAVHGLNPEPEVFLEVEAGVPCASLEGVRDAMDRYAECRAGGHCAEGVRSIWEGIPTPPGTPPS